MTDIVKRLRAQEMWFPDLYSEAAAEIERLRQVLENAQEARFLQGKAIVDASNEIERLRAALREIMGMDEVAIVEFKKGDGWLHQRVARAALEGK